MDGRMLKTLWGLLLITALLPAQAQAQEVFYIHTDALGSPVAETDASRNVVARFEYEPYGRRIGPGNDDKPGYTGHVMDAVTGLVQMQQRYYDPGIGRTLSVDPVTAYDNGDMRHFNRYAYAFNNPYKFTDPDGRQSWPVHKDENGKVVLTSAYGPRNTGIKGASTNHNGQDFRAGRGAEILAPQDGKVAAIVEGGRGGNSIFVSNDDGSMNGFAHTKATEGLKQGDRVQEGSAIGNSDGSGTGSGPHLHLTYRPGTPTDPATTSTPTVDPMKTQFKDMPKEDVCVKRAGNSC